MTDNINQNQEQFSGDCIAYKCFIKNSMADQYQQKYRISTTRMQNWDYGWNATYFVTICSQNRECYFSENQYNTQRETETERNRGAMHCVSATPNNAPNAKNQFGPQSKNLASIIRGFKIGVTTNARKIHAGFAWQSRFHDQIIRDNRSYEKNKTHIIENPIKMG